MRKSFVLQGLNAQLERINTSYPAWGNFARIAVAMRAMVVEMDVAEVFGLNWLGGASAPASFVGAPAGSAAGERGFG